MPDSFLVFPPKTDTGWYLFGTSMGTKRATATTPVVLTKRAIDQALPSEHEYHLWDSKFRGLGVRVHPSGTKTFILKKRTSSGRQVKLTIGRYGELTLDEARNRAVEMTTELIRGNDPARDRQEARRNPRFNDFAERYLTEYCEVKNKPSTLRDNRSIVRKILIPRFGARPISEFKHEDAVRLRNSFRQMPSRANRVIATLRHMMNWAEELGYRPRGSNPCPKGIMLKEKVRNRVLSEEELFRLAQALDAIEIEYRPLLPESAYRLSTVFAIRLLVLTGARMSEILTLKWSDIDLDDRSIRLRDSKTGAKSLYLSEEAVSVLRSIPRVQDNPHVITGRKKGHSLVNLEKPWRQIRKIAGIPDVRLHDLRHTYASYGVASGLGLPIVGALLGHRSAATTQRYAHIGANPARQAAEHLGHLLGSAFSTKEMQGSPEKAQERL